jgi:isocitrate dehydrogenase
VLADTLDRATGTLLNEDRSPSRKLGGLDNRGSHFYLALYWAQELASQKEDPELAAAFADLAQTLLAEEHTIVDELLGVQGSPTEIGGYYQPDPARAEAVMRPSKTLPRWTASANPSARSAWSGAMNAQSACRTACAGS